MQQVAAVGPDEHRVDLEGQLGRIGGVELSAVAGLDDQALEEADPSALEARDLLEDFADLFLVNYGPTEGVAATLDEPGRAALRVDLTTLAAGASRLPAGGPVAIPATYLEAVAIRA